MDSQSNNMPVPTDAAAKEPEPVPTRQRITKALRSKNRIEEMDMLAARRGETDPIAGLYVKIEADKLRAETEADLSIWGYTTAMPERGNGGELVPLPEPENPMQRVTKQYAVTERAGVVEHDSSSQAMDLALDARCLTMALDVANSTKAKTRIEKMLAHQAAAMHMLGMTFAAKAMLETDRIREASIANSTPYRQAACVEAARLGGAAQRAFAAFNDAALAMQKLKTGGRQTVVVQHVHVDGNGKAIVAGKIKNGGGRKPGGRNPK